METNNLVENYFITENDGRKSKAIIVECKNCYVLFLKAKRFVKVNKKNYCSIVCRNLGIRNRVKVTCAFCEIEFEKKVSSLKNSKSGLYFCCRECKDQGQRLENNITEIHPFHYGTGKSDDSKVYKRIAFNNFKHECNRCKYKDRIDILVVHHKDRNRKNKELNNLEILCPNCHSIEHRNKTGT